MGVNITSRVNKSQKNDAKQYLDDAVEDIPQEAIESQWLETIDIMRYEFRKYIIHCILEWKKTIIGIDGCDSWGKTKTSRVLTSSEDVWGGSVIQRHSLYKPKPKQLEKPILELYQKFFPWKWKTVVFDRTWNNRAFVQNILGYCSDELYEKFINTLAKELSRLQEEGYDIHSFFFYIDKNTQKQRLDKRAVSYVSNFRHSESDKKAVETHSDLEKTVVVVEKKYRKAGTPFTIIKWDNKPWLPVQVIKEFLRDKDYPKKSKDIDFSRNTLLVPASISEILKVRETKNT